jgi:8-oxo-dGTP diphosphatase
MLENCEATVAAVIEKQISNEPHCLLVKRLKPEEDPRYSGTLELPGGRIDKRTDKDILKALKREVEEETGLIITGIKQNPRIRKYQAIGVMTQSFMPFCCEFFPGRYAGFVFICEAEGELKQIGDGTRNPRYVSIGDLKRMLAEEPEIIFPYHIGALQEYVKEKEYSL